MSANYSCRRHKFSSHSTLNRPLTITYTSSSRGSKTLSSVLHRNLHLCAHILQAHTHAHANIHINTHMDTDTHAHIDMDTQTYMCTWTYIHIHITENKAFDQIIKLYTCHLLLIPSGMLPQSLNTKSKSQQFS